MSTAKPPDPQSTNTKRNWIRNVLCFLGASVRNVIQFLLVAWAALAIFYSNLPWPGMRLALAVAFAVFAVWALWWARRRFKWRCAFAAAFTAVVIWWILIPPSQHRPWRPEVAVLPRATIDGDRVRLTNSRHFHFRTNDDFDVRYEEREFSLAHVVSVDLFVSYWKIGPVAHTFVSFNFDDGTLPVCISIETRPEIGEGFDPIASMFKQVELTYVVGDERDIVGVRANHRDEDVFMYRLRVSPHASRELLRVYLERVNELADRPEWYHLLSNNCTLNIIRYSRIVGGQHARFELAHLLNGFIDRYVFGLGLVDTTWTLRNCGGARSSTTTPAPPALPQISPRRSAPRCRRRHRNEPAPVAGATRVTPYELD